MLKLRVVKSKAYDHYTSSIIDVYHVESKGLFFWHRLDGGPKFSRQDALDCINDATFRERRLAASKLGGYHHED